MQFSYKKTIETEVAKEIDRVTAMILEDQDGHESHKHVIEYWERAKDGDLTIRSEKMKAWGCTGLEYKTTVYAIYCRLLSSYVRFANTRGNRRIVPRNQKIGGQSA